MPLNFTLLKQDQIWGYDALDIMKRYGTKVAPTDLTVILCGSSDEDNRTSEGDYTCASWSASPDHDTSSIWITSSGEDVCDHVQCVGSDGSNSGSNYTGARLAVRPALPPWEASKINPREMRSIAGVRVAEYGEYPQTVADGRTSKELERLYLLRSLRPTGKNYTFDSDSVERFDYATPFKSTSYQEYEMDGKKYIRVPGNPAYDDSKLSTGEQVEKGKLYWIEVQPIEWLMDKSGWMVAKKCLFSGIQFNTKGYTGDFPKTFIKHYLDTYFAKEIEPSKLVLEHEKPKKEKKTPKAKGSVRKVLTLTKKADILDKKTASIRAKRDAFIKAAKTAGVTVKDQVQALRDEEGRARAKVYKGMLAQKYGKKK